MNTLLFSSRQTIVVATLVVGLLAAAPALVQSQGINAKVVPQAPPANAELQRMRQQLAELEKRVAELEEPEVEAPDDAEEQEARDKAVERRLAALEKSAAAKPADGQSLTLRAPFAVKDDDGEIVFQVDVPADRNLPRAVVGNPAGAHVEMGPSLGGSAVLALFDESKALQVAMVGGPQQSYLRLRDNEQSVGLGNIENSGTGLFLHKGKNQVADVSADKAGAGTVRIFGAGGKIAASLSSVPEGGTLKAFDSKQKAVAGVFAGSDGGHVTLTGPTGGKAAVHLSVTSTGGKVRVFPAEGGKARAELIADGDSGVMTVFNAAGTSAVVVESAGSGSGHLVILNAAGENAVEAGAMKAGIGIVRTGPAGSGPAGSLGSGLSPASSIQGK
jgi:hypothetical protein